MKLIGKSKFFSLEINGEVVSVPQNTVNDLVKYQKGMDIRIVDSVPGKKLSWFIFQDGRRMICVCDRILVNWISRNDCADLIRPIEVNQRRFYQSLPEAGDGPYNSYKSSDWYKLTEKLEHADKTLHVTACYSHTLGMTEDGSAVAVGYLYSDNINVIAPGFASGCTGWRPVLIFESDGTETEDKEKTTITEELGKLMCHIRQIESELNTYRIFFDNIDVKLLEEQHKWLCDQIAVLTPSGDAAAENPEGLENLVSELIRIMEEINAGEKNV